MGLLHGTSFSIRDAQRSAATDRVTPSPRPEPPCTGDPPSRGEGPADEPGMGACRALRRFALRRGEHRPEGVVRLLLPTGGGENGREILKPLELGDALRPAARPQR